MKLPSEPVTMSELFALVDLYEKNECEKKHRQMVHKGCGGAVRIGYAHVFYVNPDGTPDAGEDGLSKRPVAILYCDQCDPPDGPNHAYIQRVLIERTKGQNKQ